MNWLLRNSNRIASVLLIVSFVASAVFFGWGFANAQVEIMFVSLFICVICGGCILAWVVGFASSNSQYDAHGQPVKYFYDEKDN